ncbi:MAG: NAD-dependent epimerase/dehydratase family protein [bacterium]|nr:NAD-dependent epimerase/dehydratase family protein [bacterium]
MSEKAVFCTGTGGFIGRYILSHYLEKEDCDIYLLENGRFQERLEAYLDEQVSDPEQRKRLKAFAGDIAEPGLGLEVAIQDELKQRVTHVIHLAALYNLSAPRDISMRVNVDGTRNLLDLIAQFPSLERLGYASTIAVAGKHMGTFREDDLDLGQEFETNYDLTKHLAEKLVRERRDDIPSVILRPTTVVGHSKTGAIEKIDGPYYALGMIARGMHYIVPDTKDTLFHFAPVDFIADAFYHLFEDEDSIGKVFHLVDPEPVTYNEFFDLASAAMGKRKPLLKLPAGMMRPMGRLPGFEKVTGVPREAFEHSYVSATFDRSQVAPILAKHGVECPRVQSYLDVMVDYFMKHAADPRIRKGDWRQTTT